MLVEDLLDAVQELAERLPGAQLERNDVGNLAITTDDGAYVGYVDLYTADLELYV